MVDISQIREHAQVIGADGVKVGTVDRVEGDRIKLTKDSAGQGAHVVERSGPCRRAVRDEGTGEDRRTDDDDEDDDDDEAAREWKTHRGASGTERVIWCS